MNRDKQWLHVAKYARVKETKDYCRDVISIRTMKCKLVILCNAHIGFKCVINSKTIWSNCTKEYYEEAVFKSELGTFKKCEGRHTVQTTAEEILTF